MAVMAKIGSAVKLGGIVGVGASTALSFITDFLYPLAPFSLYILASLFLILPIACIMRFVPITHRKLSEYAPDYWFMPVIMTLLISITVFLGAYMLGSQSSGNGYLSDNSSIVSSMQSDLGVLTQQLEELNTTAKAIEKNTNSIANSNEKIVDQLGNLKKETSQNPRKELANMGITWHVDNFVAAFDARDLETFRLFAEGGMILNGWSFYESIAFPRDTDRFIKVLLDNPQAVRPFKYLCPSDPYDSSFRKFFINADKVDVRRKVVKTTCTDEEFTVDLKQNIAKFLRDPKADSEGKQAVRAARKLLL